MLLLSYIKVVSLLGFLYIFYISVITYIPHKVSMNEWKRLEPPFPSDNMDNIFWFVQVSDIHISIFHDSKRGPDFTRWCSETLEIIHPELVLVTGDLTDAKEAHDLGSQQYMEEWKIYDKILGETNITEKYLWLDIRGNHDTFDVMSRKDTNDFYLKYSGDKGKLSSSTFNLEKSFGEYSFIPIDSTIIPGPKRPFNFIGHLSKEKLDKLYNEGKAVVGNNLTIWYGHYPTSSISYGSKFGLSSIIGELGDFYLNGHFHTLHGFSTMMYAVHPSGFLEIELSDWMNNRKYRVVAIDHDMLSFADVTLDEWPVIVITNPKPAKFMTPKHEPIRRMRNSTHIRFLAFSPAAITNVSVSIDGVSMDECKHIEGPLRACRWDPSRFATGIHHLVVTIGDDVGRIRSSTSDFSLEDDWSIQTNWAGRFSLLTNFCFAVTFLFLFLVLSTLSTLILIKYHGVGVASNRRIFHIFLFKLQLLASDDVTFYVIFAFMLNLAIGPLFIGELLTGRIGVCFPGYMLINGHLYTEQFIYIYCLETLLIFYLPDIFYLAYNADLCWKKQCNFTDTLWPITSATFYNFLFIVHLIMHALWCNALYLSYGWMALVISPSRLWWVLTVLLLLYRTWRVRPYTARRG